MIKKQLILLVALISLNGYCFPKDTRPVESLDELFDLNQVPQIVIEVHPREWNNLLDYFDKNAHNEKSVHADFTFIKGNKKIKLRDVGLRVRGNLFSRTRPEGKFGEHHERNGSEWHPSHFKVSFRKYNRRNKFYGLSSLNLKCFNGDPALVREIYCMDLFRRFGVFTYTRVSYVRLSLHVKGDSQPAYLGVYRMLEPIDSHFVKERWQKEEEKGFLWKCLWPADLTLRNAEKNMGIEDPDNGKKAAYDLKTRKKDLAKAKKQFVEFIQALNEKEGDDFKKWADKTIDVDLLLRAQAVNVMVGMWDDYWGNMNNYYLYFNPQGKCYFIPYDYDNTLGTGGINNNATADFLHWGAMDGSRPLMSKILGVPEYRDKYIRFVRELISETNDLFHYSHSIPRIQAWHKLIAPYLENDLGTFDSIIDRPAEWGEASYYRLLDGDEWGGAAPANYFKTRENFALMQMGLKESPPPVNIDVDIEGLPKHPEMGYYITYEQDNKVNLKVNSEYGIKEVKLSWAVNKTFNTPQKSYPLEFSIKNQYDGERVPRAVLVVDVINTNERAVRKEFAVLRFDKSYKSPEFVGDDVIFRLKYNGEGPVELQGNFNGWGKDKKMELKKASGDIWELKVNKKELVPTAPEEGDPTNKVRYGFMVKGEKGIWKADLANTNSRRGSAFFYLK